LEIKKRAVDVDASNVFHALGMQQGRFTELVKQLSDDIEFKKAIRTKDKAKMKNALSYFINSEGFIYISLFDLQDKRLVKIEKYPNSDFDRLIPKFKNRNEPIPGTDNRGNLYIYANIWDKNVKLASLILINPFYKNIPIHTRMYFPTYFEYIFKAFLKNGYYFSSFSGKVNPRVVIEKNKKHYFVMHKGINYIGKERIIQDEIDGMFKGRIIVFFKAKDVQDIISQSAKLHLLFAGGSLLFAIMLAYLSAREFSKPILTLASATQKLTHDESYSLIGIKSKNEIGILVDNYNEMVTNLKTKDQSVREKTVEIENKSEELLKLKNHIQSVIDNMPVTVVTVDINGNINYWNAEALKRFNFPAEININGKNIFDMLYGLLEYKNLFSDTITNKTPHFIEEVMYKEGRYEDILIFPLLYNDSVNGACFKLTEVTQRVKTEQVILEAEKMRSIATISAALAHEIRNPLGIIKSSASVMQESFEQNTPNYKAADFIKLEIERLNKLITELLDFAKPKKFNLQYYNLEGLLLKTLIPLIEEIKNNKVEIKLNIADNMPEVLIDCDYFTQVIYNLVYNARDASKPDSIIFVDAYSLNGKAYISVKDEGHGMDEDTLVNIFKPFFSLKTSGTGLGLIVVKQLTEGMGGNISVKSVPDKGSEFILSFAQKE
jgi:signal transduction histidine kinase